MRTKAGLKFFICFFRRNPAFVSVKSATDFEFERTFSGSVLVLSLHDCVIQLSVKMFPPWRDIISTVMGLFDYYAGRGKNKR
jgi:hypothetical protein